MAITWQEHKDPTQIQYHSTVQLLLYYKKTEFVPLNPGLDAKLLLKTQDGSVFQTVELEVIA